MKMLRVMHFGSEKNADSFDQLHLCGDKGLFLYYFGGRGGPSIQMISLRFKSIQVSYNSWIIYGPLFKTFN